MTKRALNDLIVVLPGIMGSVLEKKEPGKKGRVVWEMSGAAAWELFRTGGDSVLSLGFVAEEEEADDGITATRLMRDLHIIPGLWTIDGYSGLSNMIRSHFRIIKEGGDELNFLEFPYDWRRGLEFSAKRFEEFIRDPLRRWRKKNKDAKLILICHSMGGLIARYWATDQGEKKTRMEDDVRAIITYGTPHRGSLNAMRFLTDELWGPLADLTKMMRTLPGLYHLLPTADCLRINGNEWTSPMKVDIEGVDARLKNQAMEFHQSIADRAKQFEDPWHGFQTFLGTEQPTRLWAEQDANKWKYYKTDRPDGNGFLQSGDGTVPQWSSIPDERERHDEDGRAEHHGSIHVNESNMQSLRQRIEALQNAEAQEVPEAPRGVPLAVGLEDLHAVGEEIIARVGAHRGDDIFVEILNADEQTPPVEIVHRVARSGRVKVSLGELPAGRYRAEFRSGLADPVHTIFGIA